VSSWMNMIRLLIVDDEPLIRTGIRSALDGFDGIEVAGECGSGAEAVDAILAQQPDLVLLDVQMPDCTGFDVVRQVGPERMPAVIFVTAYDEYAVRAFEVNAVDYLLKPFDEERVRRSIQRAQERIAQQQQVNLSQQLQSLIKAREDSWPERLVVRVKDRFEFIAVDSIEWVESANNYVYLHCGANAYILSDTLTHLEHRLNPAQFLRVHRCRIVNTARLVAMTPMLNGVYTLELRSGVRLTTGRQYNHAIQGLMRA
jgi:two-component system LytT family response regulator